MKPRIRHLSVLMNGLLVGHLHKLSNGGLEFFYDQSWLNLPGARPISLSLPLISEAFIGDVVYHFFDNLLPDNPFIRTRIQHRFQMQSDQPFDLLAGIGKDCVGAIQIIHGELPIFQKKIDAVPMDEKEIANILRDIQQAPLGMTNDDVFRISLAGAQEKTAFLYWKNTWHRPLGTTPTSHIFKLPIGYLKHQNMDLSDSCENEWLCAHIIKAFGLPVAQGVIQHFEDQKVLIVERFDRKYETTQNWLMRLPQEDICQALGISPNLKYQSDGGPGIQEIMHLLLGSHDPSTDRDIFFCSQILFFLLAAIDGHAKNFSLHIEAKGQYRLAPLYDIISAYPLMANQQLQKQKIKMAMALKGKNNHYHWQTIQRRHFLTMAKYVGYSTQRAEKHIENILSQIDSVIENVKKELPSTFPSAIADPIFNGIQNNRDRLLK